MYIISIHDFIYYRIVIIFDGLYQKYNIERMYTNRCINSDVQNRGHITELLIRNY